MTIFNATFSRAILELFKSQHGMKGSGSGKSASESSSKTADEATPPPAIVKHFQNFLSGRMGTVTLSPNDREQRADVAKALGAIMHDTFFAWNAHLFAHRQTLRMLLGTPCPSYAFLRVTPELDLEGIAFTHEDLFAPRQRNARGHFKRARFINTHDGCSASSAGLVSVGGSGMVSWLVCALLTGKNLPRDAQRFIHQQTAARGCNEVLARRHMGICRRIKVIISRACLF